MFCRLTRKADGMEQLRYDWFTMEAFLGSLYIYEHISKFSWIWLMWGSEGTLQCYQQIACVRLPVSSQNRLWLAFCSCRKSSGDWKRIRIFMKTKSLKSRKKLVQRVSTTFEYNKYFNITCISNFSSCKRNLLSTKPVSPLYLSNTLEEDRYFSGCFCKIQDPH